MAELRPVPAHCCCQEADGEKGMAANPPALQVSSLSQYDDLLLTKFFIFHAELVLSAKIPPVVKRPGVSKAASSPELPTKGGGGPCAGQGTCQ